MKTNIHFLSYLARFFLEWDTFETKFVEKTKTHLRFCISFLNLAFYEIIWKNIVERGRPQVTILRMRLACWITKATNSHRLTVCNIYCFPTTTVVSRTRRSGTLYIRCLSRYSITSNYGLITLFIKIIGIQEMLTTELKQRKYLKEALKKQEMENHLANITWILNFIRIQEIHFVR